MSRFLQSICVTLCLFAGSEVLAQTHGWDTHSNNGTTTTDDNVAVGTSPPLAIFHVAKNVALASGNDAQGMFSGLGSSALATLIGYDTTNDYGFLQAVQVGVIWGKNLRLQSKGGGTLTATRVIGAVYQDVAEWVPAAAEMVNGTVVVLDGDARDTVMPSDRAYDTRVAGVVSAQPGVLLGVEGPSKAKIATAGRVKIRVDASHAAIRAGDLRVTSDKPGLAMRSEPVDLAGVKIHRPGTLIGKALGPLERGEGEILVLLSLQ